MLTRSYSNMHLCNLICLTCLSTFFSYKKLSKKIATCAISCLNSQICCPRQSCPKILSTMQYPTMSTVQLNKLSKICCPLYYKININLEMCQKNQVTF